AIQRLNTAAQPLLDVVRAAGSEIAEYARVEPEELVEVEVIGHAVGDLVHLLAELLENATAYSAPQTRVRVTARHQGGGALLAIYDDGIGMAAEPLVTAVIYEELSSAWFRPSTPVRDAAPMLWGSPGDREREQVVQVLASDPESGSTASGLPVRRPGARLVPGSVPGPTSAAP